LAFFIFKDTSAAVENGSTLLSGLVSPVRTEMTCLAGLHASHQPAEHFPQILLGNRGHPVAQILLRVCKG
jgi:hypothetical protein